mmetsp:Transcript_46453/g.85096  ORF Transcript_46453/g.85096 Transcript_46453/m.85096 type:complete len:462 (-) Transcript_46453:165-1550(-)
MGAGLSAGTICGPEGEEFFPLCRHIVVVDDNADQNVSGKQGPQLVSTSRAARSAAAGLDAQESLAYMTMQERLHTRITDIQVEDASKALPLQSMQHQPGLVQKSPLPGDPHEPVVQDKLGLPPAAADSQDAGDDGEPQFNIDLAALIENNKDNEFLSRLLRGEDPGAVSMKFAQDGTAPKSNVANEATLVTESQDDVPRTGQDVHIDMMQESPIVTGPKGSTPDLPMRPVISGPSVQSRRPPTAAPFAQGFVPISASSGPKGRGTVNAFISGPRPGVPATAHVEDLQLAELDSIASTPPLGCERQLIEIALRKMFSKLETVAIDHIVDTFREWRLPPNVAIVQQGAPITTGPGLCILRDGVVDVLHRPKGAPAGIAELERVCTYDRTGQCFGELELIYNAPRPNGAPRKTHWSTIATRTHVTLWMITRDALQQEVLRSCYLGAEAAAWAPVTGVGNVLTMV